MTINFAVLGDSIAYGQGAARTTDAIGPRLSAHLAQAGTPNQLRVFAVPGARSDSLAAQSRAAVQWGADLALVIIGANDLTRFVPPDVAANQLESAVRRLREVGAEVIVVPAPDLSVVPWVPPAMRAIVQLGSDRLRQAQSRSAHAAGALVSDGVSALTAQFGSDTRLFSPDRFHPSSEGYRVIAEALTPALLHASASVHKRDSS